MKLTLINLHPSLRLPLASWRKTIRRLRGLAPTDPRREGDGNPQELGVVWMDDSSIAEANWKFLRHSGPTDILTFDYGNGAAEILISLDTAIRQARENRQTLDQELTLYLAHGILHLAGFDDRTAHQIRRMRRAEKQLIQKLHETRR